MNGIIGIGHFPPACPHCSSRKYQQSVEKAAPCPKAAWSGIRAWNLLVDRAGGARHSAGMARKIGLQYSGAIAHLMNRGGRPEPDHPSTGGLNESRSSKCDMLGDPFPHESAKTGQSHSLTSFTNGPAAFIKTTAGTPAHYVKITLDQILGENKIRNALAPVIQTC